jgi:hypothetical protein
MTYQLGEEESLDSLLLNENGEVINSGDIKSASKWRYLKAAIVTISIIAFTVLGVSFSKPFSASNASHAPQHLSLAAAHAALNLHPDPYGRYEYKSLNQDGQQILFGAFAETYRKIYLSDEEKDSKFNSFKTILQKVDERNEAAKRAGSSIVHGLTKFSDLSENEFQSTLLKAVPPQSKGGKSIATPTPYEGAETAVMWDGKYTTDVRDQGYCGSCWAFSSTQQIESDSIRLGLIDRSMKLSPQQIISCDKSGLGCDGGWTEKAYEYIEKVGGLNLESEYQYTAYDNELEKCRASLVKGVIGIKGYSSVLGEKNMINYVMSTGPLSVCLDSTEWSTYVSGVLTDCGDSPNHCVQIVGVDTVTDGGFWKVGFYYQYITPHPTQSCLTIMLF